MDKHKNDWKQRLGMVYSTNPNFEFVTEEEISEPVNTLPKHQQKLRVKIERAGRKGKIVTIISGFCGTETDLKALSRWLKTKLSVGGSEKDGEIVIQGEQKEKIIGILHDEGYVLAK